MKVLVACEESQAVCKVFRELGHEAYSCDLQECSGGHPEWHIQQSCIPLINGRTIFKTADGDEHVIEGRWDMIIAHPPCTYLTNGGAVRMFRSEKKVYPSYGTFQMTNVERLKQGILARDFFMMFRYADCDRIAIENPVPMGVYMLDKPTQIIQPFMFGHPYSKKTCLWLYGLPPLKETEVIKEGVTPWVNGGCKDANGNYRRFQGRRERDPKNRAKTFPGIAKAMAEQWGGVADA